MPLRYWLIILALAFAWGSTFFFNEILLRELGPVWVAAGRVSLGALGCWVWLALRGQIGWVGWPMVGHLFVFGLLQYAVPLAVYPIGQQYITSSAAGIINAMTPIMVVTVSHFWPGGERATVLKSIGVGLGFAGIVLLTLPSLHGAAASSPGGLLFTILAPFCYGLAMSYLRNLDSLDRVALTAWSLALGALVLLPLALMAEGVPHIQRAQTWAALLFVGFILTAGAFLLLFWLVPRVGGTSASSIPLIAPVSALLLGVLVLKETVLPIQYLGFAVIFCGLLFIDGRLVRGLRKDQPSG
ncbi:DMT family transporter [Loktanella sp. IMCC34160]|uniref:DMT family transporter n=1 Tax=Loktanella sp. IMCC34160 TaxID=2510646 RepID=UPI00101B8EAD|nr:DMT family transporter [Loktanella sp. IMCC34160]RYG92818.1 DMT family transporter [Loktanella sp. IMCC34160]